MAQPICVQVWFSDAAGTTLTKDSRHWFGVIA